MKRNKSKKPLEWHGRIVKFIAICAVFTFFSCEFSNGEKQKKKSLKVVNWNLQTFFDASFDGNEYAEYKSSKSGWSKEKYEERLDRLASVIKKLDADIVVMEELEKEEQLQDIANRLSGTFDFKKLYQHGLFATNKGASIGCAVLSRLPIGEITVHAIDFRSGAKQPSMRPIIQFSVYADNKTLTMFVNHWKSKSGGGTASEIWRKRQENLLARLMKNAKGKNQAILATGDFNKDISEFDVLISREDFSDKSNENESESLKTTAINEGISAQNGLANVILHGEENLAVYSPWILGNGDCMEGGSYWYKDNWEKIDHFFAAGDIELTDFRAENTGEWTYEDGRPRRYQLWNGKGYSDHLPISCIVQF